MSANTSNNQDQEIDLSLITKKIGSFFDRINTSIFMSILFFKKNILIILVLFIFGGTLGYFLDKTENVYDHEIIITPNFGSVDYLYSKIDLLESKIKSRDYAFLKSLGIQKPDKISIIEIEPIVDIYSFVGTNSGTSVTNAQNSQNFELVKLLSEDGDIKKVIKDEITSKNYQHHKIKITTDELTSNETLIIPILNYLNQNDYFDKIKKVNMENITSKMKENQNIINQIDLLLNEFSSSKNNKKNDKLVYYNENTQLNDIIQTKDRLISEIDNQKIQLVSSDKVVKDLSKTINIKNTKGINNKMKLIFPVLFVSLFIIYGLFMSFYRKQAAKISNI